MKTKLMLPLAACLTGLAAFTSHSAAQESTVTPGPTPPTQHLVGKGHHTAIRAAIGSLERAKAEMQAAAHDFGGHRVEAIAACDTAIAQLRLALQFAKEPAGPPPAQPNP